MGEVRYKTCDRCNKEISEHQFPRFVIKVTKKFEYFLLWIRDGFEYRFELCKKCEKEFKKFLKGESISDEHER